MKRMKTEGSSWRYMEPYRKRIKTEHDHHDLGSRKATTCGTIKKETPRSEVKGEMEGSTWRFMEPPIKRIKTERDPSDYGSRKTTTWGTMKIETPLLEVKGEVEDDIAKEEISFEECMANSERALANFKALGDKIEKHLKKEEDKKLKFDRLFVALSQAKENHESVFGKKEVMKKEEE